MANDAVIDIILRATNKTQAALRAPINDLEDLTGALKGSSTLWGALGTAASAALLVMGKASIDTGANAALVAQKTGMTAESFTALSYAADQMGLSSEGVEKGFRKMSTVIQQAAQGNQKAIDTLKAFGVSATDAEGKIKPMNEIIGELADGFSKTEDGPAKAALAVQLFGRAGLAMIPLLDLGRAGLEAMTAKAQELGVVISGQTADASLKFQQDLKDIHAGSQGLVNHWVADLLPTLQVVAERLVGSLEAGGALNGIFQVAAYIGTSVALTLAAISVGISTLLEVTASGIAGLAAVAAEVLSGNFSEAKESIKSTLADVAAITEKSAQDLDKIWNGNVTGPKVDTGKHKADLETIIDEDQTADQTRTQMKKDSAEKARVIHNQEIDAYKTATLGEIDAELAVYAAKKSLSAQDLVDVKKLEDDRAHILEEAHNQAIQKMKQASVEQIQAAIAVYAAKKSLTAQEQKDYGQLQTYLVEADKLRAENFKSTWTYLASAAHSGNAALATIGKAFAIGSATEDTYAAANKALASAPPPYNFVLAGAVTAVGLGNVAQIAGVPGFAQGGVIGGSSFSGDNVLIGANSQEEMLTTQDRRDTTQALLGALAALGNGGGTLIKGQMVLQVGARTLGDWIWEASRSGELRIASRAIF